MREPWIWFIAILMLTVFIACLFMIKVGLENPDLSAEGNYRKVGLAIESISLEENRDGKQATSLQPQGDRL